MDEILANEVMEHLSYLSPDHPFVTYAYEMGKLRDREVFSGCLDYLDYLYDWRCYDDESHPMHAYTASLKEMQTYGES